MYTQLAEVSRKNTADLPRGAARNTLTLRVCPRCRFLPRKPGLVSLQPCFMMFFWTPGDQWSSCDASLLTDALSLVLRSAHRIRLCALSPGMGQWGSTADLQQQLGPVSTRWDVHQADPTCTRTITVEKLKANAQPQLCKCAVCLLNVPLPGQIHLQRLKTECRLSTPRPLTFCLF